MPAIPAFQPRTQVEPAIQQRIAADFGQALPQAQARAGETMTAVGTRMLEAGKETAVIQGRVQATERLGALRAELETESDPERIRSRWAAESRAITTEIGNGLPFLARGEFNNFAAMHTAREATDVVRLQARRTTEQAEATLAQRGQQLARDAATNPRMAEVARAEYDQMIAQYAERGVLSATRAEAARQRFGADVAEAGALQLMIRNPGEAARLLADPNGPYRDLPQDARSRLAMSAANRADAMAARAEAAAGRRERAVMVGLQQVNGLLAAGVVPEERIAALQTQARGTQLEAPIRQMVADARQTGAFAAMPAPQQTAMIEGLQARVRSNTATDADLTQLQRIGGIVQAQQRDLDRDGLGRAQRDGIVPQLPPIVMSDPASINTRVAAAQQATVHYGRPVAALTEAEMTQMATVFGNGTPDQQLRIIQSMTQISDPAIGAATLRAFERVRGEGGRLEPGTLLRVARLAESDSRGAINLLSRLQSDNSDAARVAGQSAELRAAISAAATTGVLGVRNAQAALTGFGGYNQSANLDMDIIRRDAAARMAAGATPTEAVRQAIEGLNRGLAGMNDPRLAVVTFPTSAGSAATVRQGLTQLREQAVAGVTVPAGEGVTSQAAVAARNRQAATRGAVWINEGDGYALTIAGPGGERAIVARASLADIQGAARGVQAQQREESRTGATVEGRAAQSRQQAPNVVPPPSPLGTSRRRPDAPVMR